MLEIGRKKIRSLCYKRARNQPKYEADDREVLSEQCCTEAVMKKDYCCKYSELKVHLSLICKGLVLPGVL